jgi:hypothetical protein
MKPFKIIEQQKKVIDNLKFKLQYSKNKEKDAKDINTLIKAVNCLDDMLVSKYKTDALNTLIYALIYEILMQKKAYKNNLPIHEIINTIDTDIFYGSELKKIQVISILKTHELNNKIKNKTVFDKDYVDFDKLLTIFVNEFKQQFVWKK